MDHPIVDTHLHVWDPDLLSYPWLPSEPSLNRPHLMDDYRAATEGIPIERLVFLQCEADFSQFQAEAEWVAGLAKEDPRIQGIVSWAPLEKGDAVHADLEALCMLDLMRGVRRIIQFESDPGFCLRPDFIRGVQSLADYNLSFDICIKGDEQFANTLTLVRQCPDVEFILDHIGKPFIEAGTMEPWAGYMRELAALPNTWCKVSGMANEAAWNTWTIDDLRPYLDVTVDTFGFDRMVFGGDWPVVTLASTYSHWFDALSVLVASASADEKRALFHDNAMTFYRLEG